MKEPSIKIDVRGIEKPSERIKKVSGGLDKIERGDYAEILADDERMLKLSPKIIKSIGKSKFIKVWKGDDGYFHTLTEKT